MMATNSNAQTTGVHHFNLNDYAAPETDMVYWKEIFNSESIRAGYYHLKAAAIDDQKPHNFDEVYIVEKGKSKIRIGNEDFDIKQGDVIYVQANQVHYFYQIKEELDILVLFSKGPYDTQEKIDQIDNIAQLTAKRNLSKNIWNDFLKRRSMTFGLYMLPKATGGDKALTHPFDEINFVVDGDAKFTAGNQTLDIKKGSIIVVPKNTPHFFETKNGIDVFILFETKSTQ